MKEGMEAYEFPQSSLKMHTKTNIIAWTKDYDEYLRDESRLVGKADSISFPKNEAEVIEIIREIHRTGSTITTQGSRTGIVGGAVPFGGHVLNLSRMNRIGEVHGSTIAAEPGVILSDLREAAQKAGLFFPPDPTETTCSIGGMVACNASGALSFRYGPTRNWVSAVRVVLSDGDVISLKRGENYAHRRQFCLKTEGGRTIEGSLPSYRFPNVKSAAGYFVADDMDMVDLFIGMEGTLGVITYVELRLIPKPQAINGLMLFFPDEESAIKSVKTLRRVKALTTETSGLPPVAIEFFDRNALNLLRTMKDETSAFEKISTPSDRYNAAIYTEFHSQTADECEEGVIATMEAVSDYGVTEDDTWYATNDREIEQLKAFRHAIPEAVNMVIDRRKTLYPELTKLGTDMSVPDEQLEEAIRMYRAGLAQNDLESVMFGHIGNNHVHVNILPRNPDDYQKGKNLYYEWAQQVVAWGGSLSAEHGIGKLKSSFLELMFGTHGIAEMRALKKLFDPEGILNPGNLFA